MTKLTLYSIALKIFKMIVPRPIRIHIKILLEIFFFRLYYIKFCSDRRSPFLVEGNSKKTKKKLLFIINLYDFGGVETAFFNLVDGLSKKDFEIYVAVGGGIDFLKFSSSMKNLGITTFDLTYHTGERWKPWLVPQKLIGILDLAWRIKLDGVFVSNSILGYSLIPKLKYFNPHIRVVDWIHNSTSLFVKYSAQNKKFINSTIVVNKEVKITNQERLYYPSRKIYVVHNGIEITDEDISLVVKKESPIIIGYIGRLEYDKRPDIFIKFAKNLAGFNKNIQFWMIGEGALRSSLESQVKNLNLDKYVKFLGYRSDINKLLNKIHFVILTSPDEGSPLAVLEAMSRGVPVISSKVGGVPEIIREGIDGFVVDFGDIQGYVKSSLKLIQDKRLLGKMGRSARKRIEDKFNSDVFVDKIAALFK